jgi:import receptor subunit TOM20
MAAGEAAGGAGDLGGGAGNGTAAYVVSSFLNHSCEPPLAQSFAGGDHRISFTAARDIAEGEQLFTAYVDVEAPREARRGRLKWAYGFDCSCPKCLDGD